MQCSCNFLTYGDVLTHSTVEPLLSGHLGAEESGRCKEVETRVNVWTDRQKRLPLQSGGRKADLATECERHLTTEKRAKTTKLDFWFPICPSAIGQACCLICARRRQLAFPFCC